MKREKMKGTLLLTGLLALIIAVSGCTETTGGSADFETEPGCSKISEICIDDANKWVHTFEKITGPNIYGIIISESDCDDKYVQTLDRMPKLCGIKSVTRSVCTYDDCRTTYTCKCYM